MRIDDRDALIRKIAHYRHLLDLQTMQNAANSTVPSNLRCVLGRLKLRRPKSTTHSGLDISIQTPSQLETVGHVIYTSDIIKIPFSFLPR